MAYCVRSDVEDVFGVGNVNTYANIDNDGNATTITNRINRAIADADVLIDDTLRGGPYVVPFTSTPSLIKTISAKLAGVDMYEARGIQDFDEEDSSTPRHALSWHRTNAEKKLRLIRAGKVRLDVVSTITYPEVHTDL